MHPKVAIAQINSTVGDLSGNRERIARFARQAAAHHARNKPVDTAHKVTRHGKQSPPAR